MVLAAAFAAYIGMWATALVMVAATPLAWWLARRPVPLPLEATAWLVALVPPGLFPAPAGAVLRVLAVAVFVFPVALLAIRAAFDRVGPRWSVVARSLGDRPWHTFGRVELPLAFPGLLAASALVFARASTLDAAGLPVAVPAVLVWVALGRTHRAALEDAGG